MDVNKLLSAIRECAADGSRATYMREHCSDLFTQKAIGRSPVAPTLRKQEVARAERQLGFQLPELLRRLYTEVGNGGFGPGYGIYGLDKVTGDEERSLIEGYEIDSNPPQDEYPGVAWPSGLVAVCHWGCGEYSYVNCHTKRGVMYRFDIEKYDPADPTTVFRRLSDPHFSREAGSIKQWLEMWLSGELEAD